MYVLTEVYNRDITSYSVANLKDGAIDVYHLLESEYGSHPFTEDLTEQLERLDFENEVSFEIQGENAGFSVYKLENYQRVVAWCSNDGLDWDASVELVSPY